MSWSISDVGSIGIRSNTLRSLGPPTVVFPALVAQMFIYEGRNRRTCSLYYLYFCEINVVCCWGSDR